MPPFRVQIGFYKLEPYFQRADLCIDSRLARVVTKTDEIWHLEDDHGQDHVIHLQANDWSEKNTEKGRWVIQQPIPAYWIGEELTLCWLKRNCTEPESRREGFNAEVIAEDADSVTVADPDGHLHRIRRVNGHEFERTIEGKQCSVSRKDYRWVVVGRQ